MFCWNAACRSEYGGRPGEAQCASTGVHYSMLSHRQSESQVSQTEAVHSRCPLDPRVWRWQSISSYFPPLSDAAGFKKQSFGQVGHVQLSTLILRCYTSHPSIDLSLTNSITFLDAPTTSLAPTPGSWLVVVGPSHFQISPVSVSLDPSQSVCWPPHATCFLNAVTAFSLRFPNCIFAKCTGYTSSKLLNLSDA